MLTTLEQPIQSSRLKKAIELMAAHDFDSAEKELRSGISESGAAQDKVLEALFHSTLGILFKLKKDYKEAWRCYERAEKLLPHDPALKLVSARLLVEVFGQCDLAIQKAKKVLKIARNDWTFCHQAQATLGLAYLKKGDRRKAVTALERAMEGDFEGMISAGNIDFKLLEGLIRKNAGLPQCRAYLEKAIAFAQKTGEQRELNIFQQLITLFPPLPPENPPAP